MKKLVETIKPASVGVLRNLDGKGRVMLPKDFREAADFDPDEFVAIELVEIDGKVGFLITSAREEV